MKSPGECPCGCSGGTWLDPDEPKYLVLLALVERAAVTGRATPPPASRFREVYQPSRFLRIDASRRETALLAHGDQIRVDDILWRITAVHEELVWLRAARLEVHSKMLVPVDPWFLLGGKPREPAKRRRRK